MSKEGRGLVCVFCGEGFGYSGETPDEETLRAAVDHEKDCPNNPYKAQIARFREAIDSLMAWDHGQFMATGAWVVPVEVRKKIMAALHP